MTVEVHSERDPLLGITPSQVPPHVIAESISEIINAAQQLIGDAFSEPIGFYAPTAESARRQDSTTRQVPLVHESLLREVIDQNRVMDMELIPDPQRAFDPERTIAFSLLATPIRAPDGSAIASAYLARPDQHRWSTDDLTMLRSATRIAEADARLRIATVLITERGYSTAVLAEFGAELAAIRRLDEFGPAVSHAVNRMVNADASAVLELHDQRVRLIANNGFSEQDAAHMGALDTTDQGPTGVCLTTGESAYYSNRASLIEVHPTFGRLISGSVYHSWGFVPIVSEGRALGAIVLNWKLPLDVREMRRSELEEVGRIAGLALGRLRLQETARQLATIEAQLSGSPTVENVVDVVADSVRHLVGAFTIHLGLVDGNSLHRVSSSGAADDNENFDSVEMSGAARATAPVRAGNAVFLTPNDDWSEFPALSAARETLGATAMLAQPVMDEGEVIGILTAAYLDQRDCGPYERNRAKLVSVMLGRAIHRASLLDRERKITQELQRSLLPDKLPRRDGYQIATRYLAADAGLEVGGDWFDVFELRRGGLALAVGDIVGHGLQAAGAAGQLRSACRALADVSTGPTNLVHRLDEFCVHASGTQFATLLYGELDESSGRLEFCRAGHVPPVLVDQHGTPTVVEENGSWVIGLDVSVERGHGELTIAPGSRLLFFTDGLIERRGENIDVGYQRLMSAIQTHHELDCDKFADALIDELTAEVNSDDRCLLVIERT